MRGYWAASWRAGRHTGLETLEALGTHQRVVIGRVIQQALNGI